MNAWKLGATKQLARDEMPCARISHCQERGNNVKNVPDYAGETADLRLLLRRPMESDTNPPII